MKKAFNYALFNYPMLLYGDKSVQAQVEKMRIASFSLYKGKRILGNYQRLKGSVCSEIIPLNATSEDSIYHSNSLLIIADGVGGWKELGIDSGVYSRTLCERISSGINNNEGSLFSKDSFKKSIVTSINQMSTEGLLGSSTFCAVYINYLLGKAYIVTMGDTLVMILRLDTSLNKFNLLFKTEEQQHSFNMPFQCGHVGDDPEEALAFTSDISKGDVVILASDGLWDNVSKKDIIERLNREVNKVNINLESVVYDLSLKAKENSMSDDIKSPFAIKALKNNFSYFGGKPDDISLIVMQIKEEEDNNNDNDDAKSNHSKISNNSKKTSGGSEDCEY